jgi:hypothetical protein
MAKILKHVLGKTEKVRMATRSYIDDILVDETQLSSDDLIAYLKDYGFLTKPAERLSGGAALGLKLTSDAQGELWFRRGNTVPHIEEKMTRRQLFSLCGKLVGHYPIAGWVRVACSYVKRTAEGSGWEDFVGPTTMKFVKDMCQRMEREDPVYGKWNVPKITKGRAWYDASSIALGAVLEISDNIVEDAAWLKKKR